MAVYYVPKSARRFIISYKFYGQNEIVYMDKELVFWWKDKTFCYIEDGHYDEDDSDQRFQTLTKGADYTEVPVDY